MIIENGLLRASFDDVDGSLIGLYHTALGAEAITDPQSAENFRLSIPLKEDWTHIVIGKGHPARMRRVSDCAAELCWENIAVKGEPCKLSVTANVSLEGDELVSRVCVDNQTEFPVDYLWYPVLGGVTRLMENEPGNLYIPRFCGSIDEDVYAKDWIDENNRYWYTAREFKSSLYPRHSNLQMLTMAGERCGLMLSSRDTKDFYSAFYLEHERANTPMTLSIVKAPFLGAGECYDSPENVVSLFAGDWHVAAAKYRKWLTSWLVRKPRAEWVKQLDGWLAFQGHCGDMHIAHPYEEYPSWLRKAREVGLNTIHIHCGVHEEGIEGGYPYWTNFSRRMGGREKLVEVVNKIHEMGGRVVTFTKDNKVNLGLPEYEEKFAPFAVRLRDGASPRVSYCVGTLDMLCCGAQLANMCRAHPGWQEFIVDQMGEIAKVGFDGNMIDEWCSGLDLCMAKDHGHQKPTDQISQQHVLGKKILEASQKVSPEYLLAAEEICDAAYQYMDISFARGGSDQWWGRDPRLYELFRCAIPEMQCTAEILENEYPHLNYAFACGYMLILCIDYYHGTPDRYPEFAAYFKEVIRIRSEVRAFFIDGEFRDDLDHRVVSDGEVRLKSWTLGGRSLIVLWNDGPATSATVELCGQAGSVVVRQPHQENREIQGVTSFTALVEHNSMIVLEK